MARGNMSSIRQGTTGLSLNERFTLMGNVGPRRGPRSPRARGRGGASGARPPSLRSRQLVHQMENRPAVQAALRLRRTPMKPNIKQRLSLRGTARRGFRRSNSIGSLYTEPLKSEPNQKFRRGSLRRSSSMNSLNSFASNNRRSRSASRSQSRSRAESRSRSRSRSRTPQRNARGRGRGRGARIFRRNSMTGFDNSVIKRDARSFKQNRGRQISNRSRGRGVQQRWNNVRRGRSISRDRRNSMPTQQNQSPNQNRGQSTSRRGLTAGRARRGGGNRGRGGNNAAVLPIKKEQLDAELDSYMAGSKSQLDRDLDTYMSNTNMDYQ